MKCLCRKSVIYTVVVRLYWDIFIFISIRITYINSFIKKRKKLHTWKKYLFSENNLQYVFVFFNCCTEVNSLLECSISFSSAQLMHFWKALMASVCLIFSCKAAPLSSSLLVRSIVVLLSGLDVGTSSIKQVLYAKVTLEIKILLSKLYLNET